MKVILYVVRLIICRRTDSHKQERYFQTCKLFPDFKERKYTYELKRFGLVANKRVKGSDVKPTKLFKETEPV